jgi:molybdenum cofactor cytidylyltransferase
LEDNLPAGIKYGIIILAAGNSSRLGRPKQLLHFHNKSLLQNAVEQSLRVPESVVLVVTGASKEIVESELNSDHILVRYNAGWQTGMASSIKTGVSELLILYPSLDALLLTVCDQPFLNAGIMDSLIAEHTSTNKHIIASAYNDTIGTPALFSKKYFTALQELEGQEGAKKIIMKYGEDTTSVNFPAGGIDIDTNEDYRNLLNK